VNSQSATIMLIKATFAFIALLLAMMMYRYTVNQHHAISRAGKIEYLKTRQYWRKPAIIHIRLKSTDSLTFKLDQMTSFFDVVRYLQLKKSDSVAYAYVKSGEVVALSNLSKNREISVAFYSMHVINSYWLVAITQGVLILLHLGCVMFSMEELIRSNSRFSFMHRSIRKINAFFRRYKFAGIVLLVFLYFGLYQFPRYLYTLTEPVSGFKVRKYLLDYWMLFAIITLSALNLYMYKKRKGNE
jgi:hypothetical protein